MEDKLTLKEAYAAMYAYLKKLYDATSSDDLAGILGSMSLLEDGEPADPAAWADWERAVQSAKQGQVLMSLGLKQS